MNHVAIYARYSSDHQKESSIEDQIRLCRERAEREGWHVTGCYKDQAMSGASLLLRHGVQLLIQDAMAGRFDMIIAEALDRLSRDQADTANLYKQLQFHGVKLVTLSEGDINELHVGLKGTMNALFLKDLANKTRRGLRGRVEKGKSGGGKSYGYDVVRDFDVNGEAIRGDRTINKEESAIIRRIFMEYANGKAPRTIAIQLNKEGIPGPTGKAWGPSTINGNRRRGTGILNNELYIGRLVWNRLRYLKDPKTGKRVSRLNPESEWVIKEVPDLRLVDQDLWEAAKARQADLDKAGPTFNTKKRAKYVFSGLIKCGCCGSSYVMRNAYQLMCATAHNKGTCDNRLVIKRPDIEQRILEGMRDNLMRPDLFEEFCEEYTRHINRGRIHMRTAITRKQNDLEKVERELLTLVQAIKDGLPALTIKDQMIELENRKLTLKADMDNAVEPPVLLHPNMAKLYRRKLSTLADTLGDSDSGHWDEAATIIRSLVEKIVVTPGGDGVIHVDLSGDLASMLTFAASRKAKSLAGNGGNGPDSGYEIQMVAGACNFFCYSLGSVLGFAPGNDVENTHQLAA